ncbi:hypothetical protein HX045_06555 [Myroides odoratimimus]|uniref:hypothetical protein n=1 Tax=Myroides odoratimimus TaxID=76832 RepID=UPI001CE1B24E|nr:hypothetical protein [Myroides odoratimimus]MCA4804881.1 hypothetical protein [Myroides odoratimimus]MDM1064732.1 hypothetical protein [Myroides odoratimimus]MDM1400716.1 hypothetical protein [Myroides odoratimimus]MDM1410182.1 hypothetical protein [Myroides odoratimimus]MDM1449601.1 hypothetical protein [Myroides odoratimimus]
MKKIIILAAFLGTFYTASAQVGIGTPDPETSAELEILSSHRGVLIPRVSLSDLKVFAPIDGTQVESLLIYNLNEDTSKDILKGFYYWTTEDGGQWNRIVSKAELTTVINGLDNNVTKLEGDVKNIQNVINYIVPTNPDNKDAAKEGHSTIVFDPVKNEFKYVVYNTVDNKYETANVDFEDLVLKEETKTFFREVAVSDTDKTKKFLFFSETTIQNWLAQKGNEGKTENDVPNDADGVVTIDVVGEIASNVSNFFNSKTTVLKEGSTSEHYTIEELIKSISTKVDGNVIYKNTGDSTNANWEFQFYNNGKYETINLKDLVADTETTTVVVPVVKNGKTVGYKYFNEEAVKAFLASNAGKTAADITGDVTGGTEVNVVGDIVNNFSDILNQEVKEGDVTYKVGDLISKFINKGGNVYYGKIADDKEEVFYTIEDNGAKKEISFDFITNYITNNVDKIKNILGDHIDVNNSKVIFTGNTINNKKVYKFIGTTNIAKANSARTSGVAIPAGAKVGSVVSIQVLQGEMLKTTATTDIKVSGSTLNFNIGSGNQYIMIGEGNYNVIVEFTE